jgi:SAM-dependent methyltransferase
VREADRTGFEVREVVAGDNTALPDAGFTKMLAAASYPQDVQAILDEPWVFGGTGPILVRYAVTPRQAQIVRSFQESFRSIRDELADLGYSPPHSKAVLTYLALGVASLVDILSTSARWDDQRGGVRGLDRHEWHPGAEFFEVGGILIRSILARRFADIQTVIEAGGQHAVEVHSGDMTALPNADNSFDLVIWDPPFCDNISYDRLALPWTRFLRSVIGDVDADLRWPRDPTISDQPPRFDRSEYEQDLRDAAAEIHRVLRPAGRLGVFWMTRTGSEVADLSEFLQMLEPVGLELVQSFSFSTRSASHPGRDGTGEAQPLLLVFRRTGIAQASHAAAVLEGTREGRKMKVAGLVALLEESLEQEELEDLIPRGFRGTRTERLTEAVMTGVDPQKHLLLISKGELRDYALRCGAKIEDVTSLDREGLASMVFQLLGWRSPQEPPFTIGQALDEALELTDRLRLAHDEDDVRGLSTASFDRIEQVLRFCVVSWSTWLRGDGWQDCAKQLVGRANRLSFGDWYHAFVELPPTFAAEAQLVGRAGGILRRTRAWPAIQAVVAIRNRVAHPEESIIDWAGLRDESAAALNLAIDRLRAADTEGALPRVLRPVDEIRDPLGRITLRLVGHGGRHVEFLMTEQTDLTKAVVVLPSDTNPREVDPAFLDAASIAVRAGVAR